MPLRARTLLGPGPSNPYPEATVALGEPLLGHLDPEFLADPGRDVRPAAAGLRDARTGHPAALGDRVRGHGGGVRQHRRARATTSSSASNGRLRRAHGRRRLAVRGLRGAASSTSGVSRSTPPACWTSHPSPKLIAAVHAETSTGVLSDRRAAGGRQGRCRCCCADCVTSLGGVPVELDAWGVDPAYSGTQKCLGVAPGSRRSRSRPGVGAADREAAELVPRPGHARRVRRRGRGLRGADLPPHRPDRHGRLAARRARPDPRGGAGRRPRAARRGGPAAARGAGRAGAGAVRRRGVPAAGADHRACARGRGLGRRPQGTARALRPRDRRGSGRLRGHRLAHRPDGSERHRRTRWCWCWVR